MTDRLKPYVATEDGHCAVCLVDIIADEDMIVDIGDAKVHVSCATAEGYELEEEEDA
jgi:hypothetical protein